MQSRLRRRGTHAAAGLIAAAALALIGSGASGAAGKYTDPAGDARGGPDITNVAVASDPAGQLVLDPSDHRHDTLYLGTGEGNRCSSGCEAGVGLYRSRDGGEHWTKLADRCVSNATYACVNPGKDAFLGRGINGIVIDPLNAQHIFVGSIRAVRGLSHTIGNGGT